MKRMKWMVPTVTAALLMTAACTPANRYERQLRKGLASGIRYDSLFMGLSLGMTDMEFFDACWKLNEDSLVRQAIDNRSVEYVMEDELNYPATMNFYPVFAEGRIVELPVRFIYNGWSPWNKEQSASKLALDVKQWYEKIYGKGFITIEHPFRGKAYTKIDGNRRITIYIESDQFVWGVFTDMSAESASDSLQAEIQN